MPAPNPLILPVHWPVWMLITLPKYTQGQKLNVPEEHHEGKGVLQSINKTKHSKMYSLDKVISYKELVQNQFES